MSTRKWLKERGRDARSMSRSPTPPAAATKSRF
jgi:splicing factor U2AF subunit